MATPSVNFCQILLFIFGLGVCLTTCKFMGHSLDDDLLLPYADSHGPSHSHRFVRDLQHGKRTYETLAASKQSNSPVFQSKIFISDIKDHSGAHRWVNGHLTEVYDPLRSLSILEPGGPGGCERYKRELVEVTAKTRKCLVAQNGGFFDTHSGRCYGNVVSGGKLVKNSGGIQNAQFGIRTDGTLVFGYLSEEDVLDEKNPFVQLVSGVVWLLRNGEIYINESLQSEYDKTQETGKLEYFVNVTSARTAVGHDAEGKLILFHVDGQTDVRGMNLWQVAEFLKQQNVINAINLDGGGSATYVLDGSLASYPSDHWLCLPEDCSGHGHCIEGHCVCQQAWNTPGCANLTCQGACEEHGICSENGCVCDAGWTGLNCSQVCVEGFYGDGCNQICVCNNGGACDPVHGLCTCPPGFHGDSCEHECPLGFYGLNCKELCQCQNMCPCDAVTGSCNVTYEGDRNTSLHKAGHCLATQMWREWIHEEGAHKARPLLSERSWLVICSILATSLLASLAGNFVQTCRTSKVAEQRADYSYMPLREINGAAESGLEQEAQVGKALFQLQDSESYDSS